MAVAADVSPVGLITQNKGRRLNASLILAGAWRICTPEAYYTLDFSNARYHLGITMVAHNPLQLSPPPPSGIDSVIHVTPCSLLSCFCCCITW